MLILTNILIARAQPGPPYGPPPAPVTDPEAFWSTPPAAAESYPRERVWLSADYLLWWVRNGPVNTPLLTTGSAQDALPGALGQSGTQVLFGNRPLGFGASSGIRVSAGVEVQGGLGLEAGYFALERSTAGFNATSDENGNPVLARPVFDNQQLTQTAYVYALPNVASGALSADAHTVLQGGDINLTAEVYQDSSLTIRLLAGFRGMELNENLSITSTTTPLAAGFLTYLGQPADPPSSYLDTDSFRTRNQFFGGQVGGRASWASEIYSLDLVGKLALGSTQELVFVDGSSTATIGGVTTTNPGGILAQPSNIGRYFHSSFGVIPEIGLTAGVRITRYLKASCGYTFVYWNRVARPGDQIDPVVSTGQVARDPSFGTTTGTLRPVTVVRESDFWVQGLKFGLEVEY
jgi:hypothetical protein